MSSLIDSLKKGPVFTMTLECETEFPKVLNESMKTMWFNEEAVYKGFPVMDEDEEY